MFFTWTVRYFFLSGFTEFVMVFYEITWKELKSRKSAFSPDDKLKNESVYFFLDIFYTDILVKIEISNGEYT